MLLEHLKSYKLGHVISIPLFGLALWVSTFYDNISGASIDYGTFHMPFFSQFIDFFLKPIPTIFASIIALVFIILQAFQVSYLANKYSLFNIRSFMPGYLYIVLVSLYIGLQKLHPALMANFFLLAALDHLFASIKTSRSLRNVFYASLLISIGGLFYLKSVIFIMIVWITLLFLKRTSLREFLVSVLSAALPFIVVWAFYYIKNGNAKEFKVTLSLVGFIKETVYDLDLIYYIAFGFIALLTFIALVRLLANIRFKITAIRNQFMVLIFIFLLDIVAYFTGPFSLEMITFAAVALSIIISDYFIEIKKGWLPESMLYIMLVVIIFTQIIK